jgi:hypothetical protein
MHTLNWVIQYQINPSNGQLLILDDTIEIRISFDSVSHMSKSKGVLIRHIINVNRDGDSC